MNTKPSVPAELTDAFLRITKAMEDYVSLADEMDKFLYKYVKGMIQGYDSEKGAFVFRLSKSEDSVVTGKPRVLVGQIIEGLRAALEYMVFAMSKRNHPDFKERYPQFVIADSESAFKKEAKKRLCYLTEEQIRFFEQLQPYHGYGTLGIMNEWANSGKHRHLHTIVERTSLTVIFGEMANQDKYEGAWVYPQEKGCAVFVKPKHDIPLALLMRKYDAMRILDTMITDTVTIIQGSQHYFT